MNIGIVLYPTFGGSGVVATELGMALAKKGHKVHFISYQQPARLDSFLENVFYHEVRTPTYPLFDFAPYEVALTSKLVDVALNEELDVIHVHYAIPHASAAYLAQQILKTHHRYVPVVCTLHGTDITLVGQDASYKPVITFAINNVDAVTAVSDDLKQDTLKHFDVTKNIHVIYNFIDNNLYQTTPTDDCLRKFVAPQGEKVIMHVSNFRPVKRIPDAIRAFHLIREKIAAKLVLVGDGPERTVVQDLVKELGLTDYVTFLGKIKSTEKILPCADLFLLPSATESFGVSALEALACGVPVVATNAGGTKEVQKDGVTGFLCDVGDYKKMAEQSIYILENEERLLAFKKNAKEQALNFDLKVLLPQYEHLYEQVIENGKTKI